MLLESAIHPNPSVLDDPNVRYQTIHKGMAHLHWSGRKEVVLIGALSQQQLGCSMLTIGA